MIKIKYYLPMVAGLMLSQTSMGQTGGRSEEPVKPEVDITTSAPLPTSKLAFNEDEKISMNIFSSNVVGEAQCNLIIETIGGKINGKDKYEVKDISINKIQETLNGLYYVPAENANSSNPDNNFSVKLTVKSVGGEFPTVTREVVFEIKQQNDPPKLSDKPVILVCDERGSATFSAEQLVGAGKTLESIDPDIATGQQSVAQLVVTIQKLPAKGVLKNGSHTYTVGEKLPLTEFVGLVYTHTKSDAKANDFDEFLISINDGVVETAPATIRVNLNPKNVAPVAEAGLEGILQGATRPLDVNVDWGDEYDTDNAGDCQFRIVSISDNGQGVYFFDKNGDGKYTKGEELVPGGWLSLKDYPLGKIFYKHNGEEPDNSSFSEITLKFKDKGGYEGSTEILESENFTFQTKIRPNNDDPIITNFASLGMTCKEGTAMLITTDIIHVEDTDCTDPKELVFTVCGETKSYGQFEKFATYSIEGVSGDKDDVNSWVHLTPGQAFTYQDIIDGNIRYRSYRNIEEDKTELLRLKLKDSRYGYNIYTGEANREGGFRGYLTDEDGNFVLDEDGNMIYNYDGEIIEFNLTCTVEENGVLSGGEGPREYLLWYHFNQIADDEYVGEFQEGETATITDKNILYAAGFDIYDLADKDRENRIGHEDIKPENIIFTIVTPFNNGVMTLDGRELDVMDHFSQQDVLDGKLKFEHDGTDSYVCTMYYNASIGISDLESNCKDFLNVPLTIQFGNINDKPDVSGSAVCLEGGEVALDKIIITDDDLTEDGSPLDKLWVRIENNPDLKGKIWCSVADGEYQEYTDFDTWYLYTRENHVLYNEDNHIVRFKFVHDDTEPRVAGDKTDFPLSALDRNPWDSDNAAILGTHTSSGTFNITIQEVNNQPMIAVIPVSVSTVDGASNPVVIQTIAGGGKLTSVNNVHTSVQEAGFSLVTSSHLYAVDKDNTELQRQYIVVTPPMYGTLYMDYNTEGKKENVLGANSTFSQIDINNGRVAYKHNGKAPVQLNSLPNIKATYIDEGGNEREFWYNDYVEFRLSDAVSGITESKFLLLRITNLNEDPVFDNAQTNIDVFADGSGFVEIPKPVDISDPDIVPGATGVIDKMYAKVWVTDKSQNPLPVYKVQNSCDVEGVQKRVNSDGSVEFYGSIEGINQALSCIKISCSEDRNTTDDLLHIKANDEILDGESWKPFNPTYWNGGDACREGADGISEITIKITQSNKNDVPVLTNKAEVATKEDTPIIIGGFNITDPDNFDRPGYSLKVTVSDIKYADDTDCDLEEAMPTLSVTSLSELTLTELIDELNKLKVSPAKDFNGSFVVNYEIQDFDHSVNKDGVASSNTVTGKTKVIVERTNDTPVFNCPGTIYFVSGEQIPFTGNNKITISDAGDLKYGADDKFTVTLKKSDHKTKPNDEPDHLYIKGVEVFTEDECQFTGTIDEINEFLETVTYGVPDNNDNDIHDFTITINDELNGGPEGGKAIGTKVIHINVSAKNDHPEFVFGGEADMPWAETSTKNLFEYPAQDINVNENETLAFTGANSIQFNDDSFGAKEKMTISVTYGSITYTDAKGKEVTIKGQASFTDTEVNLNKILASMVYHPKDEDFYGDDAVTITVNDLGNTAEVKEEKTSFITLNLHIQNVNDTPTMAAKNVEVAPIDEGNLDSDGKRIYASDFDYSDQKDAQTAESDHNDPVLDKAYIKYIAVVGNAATAEQGRWQIKVDGNWLNIPTDASDNNAYIFDNDNDKGVDFRFVPASEDYYGTPGKLTVKFSDGYTAETNVGNLVGCKLTSDSWTANQGTISTKVLGVNDAPTFSVNGAKWSDTYVPVIESNEEEEISILSKDLNISFDDIDDEGKPMSITITVSNGIVTFGNQKIGTASGATASSTISGTKAELNEKLSKMKFQGATDFFTTDSRKATVSLLVNDKGNTGKGGEMTTSLNSFEVRVLNINDRPALKKTVYALPDTPEDNQATIKVSGSLFDYNDDKDFVENAEPKYLAIVGNQASDDQGYWAIHTSSGDFVKIPSDASVDNAYIFPEGTEVKFFPAPNYHGEVGELLVKFSDQTANKPDAGNFIGVAIKTGPNDPWTAETGKITLKYTAVNDAPVISLGGDEAVSQKDMEPIDEEQKIALTGSNLIQISDSDWNEDPNTKLEISFESLNGYVSINGQKVTGPIQGTLTELNKKLESLTFTGDQDYYSTEDHPEAWMKMTVNDKGNCGDGGEKTDAIMLKFKVNPVNDRPVLTPGSQTISLTEDIEDKDGIVIDPKQYGFTDQKDAPIHADEPKYIAIVGDASTEEQGHWQVKIDGVWKDLPENISQENALVLDKDTPIRFVPNKDVNSLNNGAGDLTIKISDGTVNSDDLNKQVAISDKDDSPWTKDNITLKVDIKPVNDAPILIKDEDDNVIADTEVITALETDDVVKGKLDVTDYFVDVDDKDKGHGKTEMKIVADVDEEGKIPGTYGDLYINPDGTYRYEINNDYVNSLANDGKDLVDEFEYRVTDGELVSDEIGKIQIRIANLPNADIADINAVITNDDHTVYVPVSIDGLLKADLTTIEATTNNGDNCMAAIDFEGLQKAIINIQKGDATVNVPVVILGRDIPQDDKQFTVTISASDKSQLNVVTATATVNLYNSVTIPGSLQLQNPENYKKLNSYGDFAAPYEKEFTLIGSTENINGKHDFIGYQWQVSIVDKDGTVHDFENIPGETNADFSTVVQQIKETYIYRRVATWEVEKIDEAGKIYKEKVEEISNSISFYGFFSYVEINDTKFTYGNSKLGTDILTSSTNEKDEAIDEAGHIEWYIDCDPKEEGSQPTPEGTMLIPGHHTIVAVFIPNDPLENKKGYSLIYDVDVAKKQLTATDPEVLPWRYVDGDNTCDVTADGELLGVVDCGLLQPFADCDDVTMKVTASYSDSEIGDKKQVTVHYELVGSQADYYIAPLDFTTTADIRTREIAITDIKDNLRQYCEGDEMLISFKPAKGIVYEYKLEFESSTGLSDVDWTEYEGGDISYVFHRYNKFGTYNVTLTVRTQKDQHNQGGDEAAYDIKFGLRIPNEYMVAKFHDVVLVNNKTDEFVAYQWYKNDEIQDGKTEQFWQDKSGDNNGLEGWYVAEVVTVYGDTLKTCPVFYDDLQVSNHVKLAVYPNPVVSGNDVTIELKDINEEQLRQTQIMIYSDNGRLAKQMKNVERINTTQLQPGEYVGKAVIGTETRSFKIIVK